MRDYLVSFIVPCLNEEDSIKPLFEAVKAAMDSLYGEGYHYEVIFMDNRSTDGTWRNIAELAKRYWQVHGLRFSRNFGYQHSIMAGYAAARGDAVVLLDCDGQDPPGLVPEFIRWWQAGAKVVYGVRRSRQEGWLITAARKIFYRLIAALSEDRLPVDAGDFRLLDRQVVDELLRVQDADPYVRGAVAGLGFTQVSVPYDRAARVRGESKFSLADYFRLAVDGILNHSTVPLRFAAYFGAATSAVTLAGVVWCAAAKFIFGREWPRGFATTTVLILLSLSTNALFFAILGEYLGRIYRQVKRRPGVIVEERTL